MHLTLLDPGGFVALLQVLMIDVVLAGDVFYERPMAARVEPFLRAAQGAGAAVLFGDPGRAYLPAAGIEPLAVYDVPVPRAIEDRDIRTTRVWRFI